MSLQRDCLCPGWKWFLWTVHFLRFSCTSLKILSSRLDVSYSFSISYGLHGSAHFWACSIISGVKHRSKRIPLMLNLGRSQRLDHGFGFIFTFNYKRKRETDMKPFNLEAKHSRCQMYQYRMLQMRNVLLEHLTGLTGTSPVISKWTGCISKLKELYSGRASLKYMRVSSSLFSSFNTSILRTRGLYNS